MAEQGFVLGVDLGTSNTVAVVRWPDGRTRPLLFDGHPILPSGVYLDAEQRLHVGWDAQRLAEADPGRYEPNPKRRIDEGTVLLGDRSVPTVDLLAAVLGAVARAAVEAVGFLPPAVLTYPAAWGARRREVLSTAAGRAGWPPPRLNPEPVAAARYFADVLRRPVPVGASLAVFDFGGGTLDVAIVRNDGPGPDGRARFAVLGSGGLPDLGGVDLDAALVEHIGGLVAQSAPQVWQRLSEPRTPIDLRDRRRLWENVRGAKEMLSRTASVPVAVPGVDQAVHLTREELEHRITPLLRRGVHETGGVIARALMRPDQIAGLFLVGGSSRVPLVARLLHAELGVAPIVLEQPELPVAEGAIAELAPPPAPETSTVEAAAEPTAPILSVDAPQGTVRRPWYRRPVWWAAAGAVVAVLVATVVVAFALRDSYPEAKFQSLDEVVSIAMGEDPESSQGAFTAIQGDRAYLAWQREDTLEVIGVDLERRAELWRRPMPGPSEQWAGLTALPTAIVVRAHNTGLDEPRAFYVLDPGTGDVRWQRDTHGEDSLLYTPDVIVLTDRIGHALRGLDLRTGIQLWEKPLPKDQYDYDNVAVFRVTTDRRLAGPATLDGSSTDIDPDEHRIVLIGMDRVMRVYDVRDGQMLAERGNVGAPDDFYLAYGGRLFAASKDNGYRIDSYDLTRPGEPRSVYTVPQETRRLLDLAPCGEDRLCALDVANFDAESTELVAINTVDGGQLWRRPNPAGERLVTIGDRVMVTTTESPPVTRIFDPSGAEVANRPGTGARVNSGSALIFSAVSTTTGDVSLAGVGTHSRARTELGMMNDVRAGVCAWNAELIACPGTESFTIWRFAARQ